MTHNSSNYNQIPFEIFEKIFGHFKIKSSKRNEEEYEWEKNELRQFLLVCKSWSLAVRKLLGPDVSIQLYYESQLKLLLKDIPSFGHEVKSLLLPGSSDTSEEKNAYSNQLWKILLHCPNVSLLEFFGDEIDTYLAMLVERKTKLRNLKKIHANLKCSYPTGLIYLRALHRYRSTIKSLVLKNLDVILKDSFFDFIAGFLELTELAVTNYRTQKFFNVSKLLEATPKLQKLHLSSMGLITSNYQEGNTTLPIEYLHLDFVHLEARKIHAKDLLYIMKQIKHASKIHVCIDKITGETESEEEKIQLLEDLNICTAGKKFVVVKFKFGKHWCSLNPSDISADIKEMSFERVRQELAEDSWNRRTHRSEAEKKYHHGDWNQPYLEGYIGDDEDRKTDY